jgi:hypothetical protein
LHKIAADRPSRAAALCSAREWQMFCAYALSKHQYNEHTRLLEGELQRRVCATENAQFWSQYMNTHPGNLDGSKSPGDTYVLLACTKRPLAELEAAGLLRRRKPAWAGLMGGGSIQTLCAKLRTGAKDRKLARPRAAAIKERTTSDDLPDSEKLLDQRRLVIIHALGHRHRDRKDAVSNCYQLIQLWADGSVSSVSGPLSAEGKGGQIFLHDIDCSPAEAKRAFEKAVVAQIKKGFKEQPRCEARAAASSHS